MKSDLGRRLQRIIDQPGALSPVKGVVWQPTEGLGGRRQDRDIFWTTGERKEFGDHTSRVTRRTRRAAKKELKK
jgi:hypothetical protein